MGREKHERTRILIASDIPLVREGLRHILTRCHSLEVVGIVGSMAETLRMVGEWQPDVLLFEPYMRSTPDGHEKDGWQILRLLHGEWPDVRIIIYTLHPWEEALVQSLQAGCAGYLTPFEESALVLQAIRTVTQGGTFIPQNLLMGLVRHVQVLAEHNQVTLKGKTDVALTERECEVLQWVARGERNKEIASRLHISEPTVKSHLASIFYKLNVDSRTLAVAVALEMGLLPSTVIREIV